MDISLTAIQLSSGVQARKYNIVDPLSRLVVHATAERETEFDEYIKFVVYQAAPVAITPREIEQISSAFGTRSSRRPIGGINRLQACVGCHGCQLTHLPSRPLPTRRTESPTGPWANVTIDLLGAMPMEEYIFVVVDYYSRFFEIDILRTVQASNMIRSLKKIFACYGSPDYITTDNEPQFIDQCFNKCLRAYSVTHRTTPPLWPRANGEVERQNKTLLKAMKIPHAEGKDWRRELQTFLFAYRATPHCTTGVSPAEAFLNRKICCKFLFCLWKNLDEEMRDTDWRKKALSAENNSSNRVAGDNIKVGDTVIVEQRKATKLSTTYEKDPYEVIDRTGPEVIVRRGDRTIRRHVAHTRLHQEKEISSRVWSSQIPFLKYLFVLQKSRKHPSLSLGIACKQ